MATAAAPADEATFYLDELDFDAPHNERNRWENPYLQRFALVTTGGLSLSAGLVFLLYSEWNAGAWIWVAAGGVALLVQALFLWNRRPYVRLTSGGLSFRQRRLSAEHSLRWDDVERLDLKPTTVVFQRIDADPLSLRFDALSYTCLRQLKAHLADEAHQHDVPVSER